MMEDSILVCNVGSAASLSSLGFSFDAVLKSDFKADCRKGLPTPGVEMPKHSSNGFIPSVKIESKKLGVS